MSPNAATKGNAFLWKPGTEREISMDTSKALTKEEAPQAWSEIIPLGFLPVVALPPKTLPSCTLTLEGRVLGGCSASFLLQ